MEEFLTTWGYLGIFLGIVATGLGFPMPEELPVVIGGALVGGEQSDFWMLPVCIVGVIVGDGFLYAIGRFWGTRLVELPVVKKRLLRPERLESIRDNFRKYGVKILLFARLTPGIRAPIFLTAGITHLPIVKFLLADAIYAVPGVTLLFFLGYFFTERMVTIVRDEAEHVKSIIVLIVIVGVAGYFLYRFLRRPVVTGDPKELPPLVNPVQETISQMTSKIMHHDKGPSNGEDGATVEEPAMKNGEGGKP